MLLARSLKSRGLAVAHVVLPVIDRAPARPEDPEVVERRPPRRGRLHGPHEALAIWRALTQADARVVVVRGSGGYVVPAAAWCERHRRDFVFAASNNLDFDLARSDRRRTTLRAYGMAARRARRIVVQTQRQLELCRQAFPASEATLIPSFAEPAAAASEDRKYFLWSDRLTEYKRPDEFVELAARVPEAPFLMVASRTAETTPELSERIEARARQIPNLELRPRCSRPELLEAMNDAVAIVKTSEVEGMPNTFLEAWARSIPVLSLSVDPDDRIAECESGLLAKGSLDTLAAQVRLLWSDRELRDALGAHGRAFVESHHSIDAVADRWASLLAELLGRTQAAAGPPRKDAARG